VITQYFSKKKKKNPIVVRPYGLAQKVGDPIFIFPYETPCKLQPGPLRLVIFIFIILIVVTLQTKRKNSTRLYKLNTV
jgi:hypothetical protein